MARRSEHTREQLHDLALKAAGRIVAREGISALTARRLAAAIGYTVGSLYLVFRNLDDLVLQLNAQTLDELHQQARGVAEKQPDPRARLLAMAGAYVRFAGEHRHLWRLVYEHRQPARLPAWYPERVARLFALVEGALAELAPARRPAEIRQAARALWSGVHGVCVLAMTGRFDDSSETAVQGMAGLLVSNFLDGFVATARTARRPAARRRTG